MESTTMSSGEDYGQLIHEENRIVFDILEIDGERVDVLEAIDNQYPQAQYKHEEDGVKIRLYWYIARDAAALAGDQTPVGMDPHTKYEMIYEIDDNGIFGVWSPTKDVRPLVDSVVRLTSDAPISLDARWRVYTYFWFDNHTTLDPLFDALDPEIVDRRIDEETVVLHFDDSYWKIKRNGRAEPFELDPDFPQQDINRLLTRLNNCL